MPSRARCVPRPPLVGRPRGRCLHRRGRLHRPVDGARARARPTRRCASPCVEKEVAGFGASGRNGGWCSALFATSDAAAGPALRPRRHAGHAPGHAGHGRRGRRGRRTHEGIDCHFAKGGTVDGGAHRRHSGPGPWPRWRRPAPCGFGEDDLRWLERAEARGAGRHGRGCSAPPSPRTAPPSNRPSWPAAWPRRSNAAASHSTSTPRSSTSSPADRGAPGRAHDGGTVTRGRGRAGPRGLDADAARQARTLVPVYSLMVATEPLGDAFWAGPGLRAAPPSPTTGT